MSDSARAAGRRRIRWILVGLTLFGAFAFLAGIVVRDQGWFPSAQMTSAKQLVNRLLSPSRPEGGTNVRSVSTGFVRLDLRTLRVPVDRPGEGGALTSVGEDLLVLTHEGGLFTSRGESVERTSIAPPENHFAAYRLEADSGKFQHLRHEFLSFRYNDVLYYESDALGFLIVSYTEWRPESECYVNALARLELGAPPISIQQVEAGPDDWTVFFRTEPCLPLKRVVRAIEGHVAGGRVAYGGNGRVLLGSGDYHWDGLYGPEALAQDSANDYGKVIEVDAETGASRHLSRGNRNVQGIVVDRSDRIWAVEHGPRGGDELNLIRPGANYGWPLATLGTRYNTLPWPTARQLGRHDDFDGPVFAWVPSIGISNVLQISGFHPSWDGDLLVSSLMAQSLFRVRLQGERVVFVEPIEIRDRIRYAHQHTDGRIALWVSNARLIWVTPSETPSALAHVEQLIQGADLTEPRRNALRTTLQTCLECHSFEPGNDRGGPSLGDVFGRSMGSTSFPDYSPALRQREGQWGEQELRRFLLDPSSFLPGTTMPGASLSEQQVDDLVDLLRRLGEPE